MSIKVLKAGLLTTVQDLGRCGYREFGIATNGVLDEYSCEIANWLVGNDKNQAVLEVTHIGPTLEFTTAVTVGIAGAKFDIYINDQQVMMNSTLHLKKGDVLKFGKLHTGARAYVAFAGRLTIKPVMGSASTSLLANFGGLEGRALKDGDVIDIEPADFTDSRVTPSELSEEHHHNLLQNHIIARVTEGREFSQLSSSSQARLLESNYEVTSFSNRMAIKLDGEALELSEDLSMTTTAIVAGTIQLPPNGQPIITLADGQTAGGYPRIGQVISADLSLLAQLKPNDTLSFYQVDIQKAVETLKAKNQYIKQVLTS
ncbi:biotin-dependent carboxyltransferase family protein [Kangiella marina]|uniref:Biotin-dependent carboxyltransferase family protein n=1 Tax=Kangiella marina TaxID=1079178 RepID=A0ABP8ILM8_9GAMM